MELAIENEHISFLKRRYDGLKSSPERTQVENHCQDIADVISPRKATFTGYRTPGTKRMTHVLDSTGVTANDLLAAGLHGLATNPSTKWFSLRIVGQRIRGPDGKRIDINEIPEVQEYLSDVEDIMWQRLYQPGSGFTTALHECYLDLGAFGTSILFVGQRDNGGLLFQDRSLGECLIAENDEGRVDTVFRCTPYTVRQLYAMRKTKQNPDGWELSDKVLQMWEQKEWDTPVNVVHAVYPRDEREPNARSSENMPWASCYFEYDTGHQLEMSGFPEFPYLVARWSKFGAEVYGRSPGMTALPDVKMLQAMELAKIKLLQKAADPPMWLRDDGLVGQQRAHPGGITYWRGNPNDGVMLQPVSMQGIQALIADQEALRQRILRTFYADIMRMLDQRTQQMTAFEVAQRTGETMRLLGPLIGRLEGEMLGPLVDRVFGILSRQGLLPDAPEIIQDMEFTVEYVSPIATAQKQTALNSVMQAFQLPMMFGPEIAVQIIKKNVNIDKTFRWAWDVLNNDPSLLVDEDDLDQANNMEQAAQNIQMAQPVMDMLTKGGQAAKSSAGALKDLGATQNEGGIDLASMVQSGIAGFQRPRQGVAAVQRMGSALNDASQAA